MPEVAAKRLNATSIVARNLSILVDWEEARLGVGELAEKYELTTRQVYRILSDVEALREVARAMAIGS